MTPEFAVGLVGAFAVLLALGGYVVEERRSGRADSRRRSARWQAHR